MRPAGLLLAVLSMACSSSHPVGRFRCDDPGSIMVNEIDYDQGDVDDAEFIELINVTGAPVDLAGQELWLVHGGTLPLREMPYGRLAFAGVETVIDDGGYALITAPARTDGTFAVPAPAGVPRFVLEGPETAERLSDEPAAVVVLRIPGVEAGPAAGAAYEGTILFIDERTDGGLPRFVATSIGPDRGTDPGAGSSLARVPDGCFLGDARFEVTAPTPGRPNR